MNPASSSKPIETLAAERRVSTWSLVWLSALLLAPGAAAAIWHALRDATVPIREAALFSPRRSDALAEPSQADEIASDAALLEAQPEQIAQINTSESGFRVHYAVRCIALSPQKNLLTPEQIVCSEHGSRAPPVC
jgi:hypothetical protein